MKQITIKDIEALNPCYQPTKYIPDTWTGTTVDILKLSYVPTKDRLWVVVGSAFLSDRTLKLYGLACARRAEKYTTDERAKKCNDMTEAFLDGKATKDELAATSVATYTAYYAATDAAYYAAADAAYYAARAAYYAARAATYTATNATTYAAADAAAYAAAYAATDAAYYAAYAAAEQEEQCLLLIKLIEENEK